ncbi:transmembrane gamma-carboxyglutamic acid protein 2-like isoform X2 [Perca fluviatilis]|uniref:transmembrane gamma-carboxyglutamic acid protein 2-like isoform X2 n=1 Tax=Perca fluviatilis TaxID=8168 RepID=UPI001964AF95|nr:transmembrane gamma-carboxyglutamic acid protein 2-like isoform X2 [Perca fluviatilis]
MSRIHQFSQRRRDGETDRLGWIWQVLTVLTVLTVLLAGHFWIMLELKPAVLLLLLLHGCLAQHVFWSSQRASQVLVRSRRANLGYFEELKPGRECVEEICDYEEAREVFEQPDTTESFWCRYLECGGAWTTLRTRGRINVIRKCITPALVCIASHRPTVKKKKIK